MSPLPFAPPPKDSSLYQQLESTTLQTLTADQLDTIRAKTFSQGTEGNEDEYRRLLLLGLAADQLSLSGPIPKTTKIVTATATASSSNVTLFTPAEGETWAVTAFAQNKDGTFGSNIYGYLLADDGNQTTTVDMMVKGIVSTLDPINDTDFGNTIYVDENITLIYRAYHSGGFPAGGTVEGQILCTRVR